MKQIILLLFLIGSSTLWAIPETVEINNILYDKVSLEGSGGARVVGFNGEGSFVIPPTVTYQGNERIVTYIASSAVNYGQNICSLTIGANITKIDAKASFSKYSTEVPVPDGILSEECEIPLIPKIIWLTNTPPQGYENFEGGINYVSNDLYTSFKNKIVYPFLSSLFEVGGVKYVPISISDRTCDAIDCIYNESSKTVTIGETVSYKGVSMTIKNIGPYAFVDNNYLENVELSLEGTIGRFAFYMCHNLRGIVIPDGVTSLDVFSFAGCDNMEYAKIGSGLKKIEKYTFFACKNLKDVLIGTNVVSIERAAFSYCSQLPLIKIPKSVLNIENYAFFTCGLQTIIMEDQDTPSFSKEPLILEDWESEEYTDEKIYEFNVTTGDILSFDYYGIPKGGGDFIEITINGVRAELEKTETLIGTYSHSFDFSGKIKMLVQTRGNHFGIYNIFVGELPKGALRLASNGSKPLFGNYCPLDSVYIGRKILYPALSSTGYSPFYRKTTLRSIRITDMETRLPNNEFYGCTGLRNVWIGNRVTSICNWTFSDCFHLEFFEFGNSVKTIGKEAFSDCTSVTRLISHATTPPTCDTQALDDINKWNCTLCVPNGSIGAYQAAPQWKEFLFVDIITAGIQCLDADGQTFNFYDLRGRKVRSTGELLDGLPRGIYIVNGKKMLINKRL